MGLLEAHSALAGKIAIVVGGAAGHLGRGASLALARAGVVVICCDNDLDGVAAIKGEASGLRGTVEAHYAEVADPASLDAFYDMLEGEVGGADILINMAGGVRRSLFDRTSREDHARDVRLNYGYVVDSCQRALPLLRKSGNGGSIVNFTTIEAHRGASTFAVYAGGKAATTNFSRALAVELGAEQIRVNCVATDTTLARASNAALAPEDFERLAELGEDALAKSIEFYVPQKRPPSVDDVMNGVLFLASDLSRAITGTTLHIDGGTIASLGFIDWPHGDSFMPAPLGGTLKKLVGTDG
ncbi:SDR family NAD(P)-dependent oxidoreductase [Novosphingobium sp. 9U]|uniref:SDR family NAD(P)-dependent oxidoreductase n=1 Tax=Novosphingobium sp. 9U TaxID=2653158 RepID=UPI0012F2CE47|nr:SDR family oxidoreductase [Novosphingobium sp. 9U]VWX50703.1 putative 3-oxoacyl-(acyl-carrier-protein) reductase FabG [Novosphingobium sp. 9U]